MREIDGYLLTKDEADLCLALIRGNDKENAFEMCLRMFRDRAAFWNKHIMPGHQDISATYETAANMLEYAMQNNIECLRQFDYYGG